MRTAPPTDRQARTHAVPLLTAAGLLIYRLGDMVEQSGLTVSEAASRLGVHPSRVRALIHAGDLAARSVGGRWFIDPESVNARTAQGTASGRRFTPARAWGLLFLADDHRPTWLDSNAVWKLRRLLHVHGLDMLRPRLVGRGRRTAWRAHPSDVPRIREEQGLCRTGASTEAAASAGLIASDLVDGYLPSEAQASLIATYGLRPSDQPNVVLRVVPRFADPWPLGREAPMSVVAVDLVEDPDPRTRAVGQSMIRPYRWPTATIGTNTSAMSRGSSS